MDFKKLVRDVSPARVVGVGESTHGTHEFFDTKAKLFIELVTNHKFNTLMLEDSQGQCLQINQYIKTGTGNLKQLVNNLYSVWHVKELIKLIQWMRENHVNYDLEFVGFDINQSTQDINRRDELMADNVLRYIRSNPAHRSFVWAHNEHVKTFSEDKHFKPMGTYLKKALNEDYRAVIQFFGRGAFNATHIDANNPNSKERSLQPVKAVDLPPHLLENRLNVLKDRGYLISNNELREKGFNNVYVARSLGWGLVPSRLNEYTVQCNPVKECNWLIYYPKSSPSHLMQG